MSNLVVRAAVEKTLYHFDKLFDYAVPDYLCDKAKAGVRILVPFGGGNKKRQAVIMQTYTANETDNMRCLKSVSAILDDSPLLSKEMLKLVCSMKERFYCTYFDAVKAMLPLGVNYRVSSVYGLTEKDDYSALNDEQKRIISLFSGKKRKIKQNDLFAKLGIDCESKDLTYLLENGYLVKSATAMRRIGDASVRMIRLSNRYSTDIKLSPRQREVFELLQIVGAASVKEVCYYTGVSASVADALVKKTVCEYFDEEVYRIPENSYSAAAEKIILTEEQQKAYNELLAHAESGKPSVSLLYGVTGAGKTSVFLKLMQTVYEKGRGVIVMVPEISLTPQLVSLFKSRFGQDVAVFHSALSMGERLDEWKRVKKGIAKIAVGTRSAVFAPFDDIGLIIMDEEQEYTYKSEASPRFHAREVAKLRCVEHNALLLLSSATPAIESFYNARCGIYSMSKLTKRYGKAELPDVIISDMNIELQKGNNTGFGSALLEAIEENLECGDQSIILLNRRGYNTFVTCTACKNVVSCPNCSISLTYHSANNRLMCHYCGFSMKITDKCPSCGSHDLRYSGSGTQKAEQTISEIFPSARVLRLDADSTMAKQAHEKKLAEFKNGNYDILLGTQMVAKGLDFPKVTLVGVLSADQTLYSEDYRSYERTFSLLTQVVGRSGRGEKHGRAVIQTYTPENPIMELSAAQNYEEFYKSEIEIRRAMLYPPFSDICMIGIIGEREDKTAAAAKVFVQLLCGIMKDEYPELPIRILGPTPATVFRVNNKYRYKIILKFRNSKRFREMLSGALREFGRDKRFSSVSVCADVNPDNIL